MAMRDFRPLLVTWAATLLAFGAWWWTVHHLAVWAELLKPLLPLVFLPAIWRSWRWMHARRKDRRDHDRRMLNRREG